MRILFHGCALALFAWSLTPRSLPDREPSASTTKTDRLALPALDPSLAEVCATGCAAEPDPSEDEAAAAVANALQAFAANGEGALDELLFHGPATQAALERGASGLSAEAEELLRRELSRTHVELDVRLVDERGVERLRLGSKRVPIGEKQHVHPRRTERLASPEVSGTVQRVGREHLWIRL